jgi:formylglycine-generating enzyme required for sulfatase activity
MININLGRGRQVCLSILISLMFLSGISSCRKKTGVAHDRPINAGTLTANCPSYEEWPFSDKEAEERQKETSQILGIPIECTIDVDDNVSMDFVLIPAGIFQMGLKDCSENLPHEVTIKRPFYIAKYETTWLQYKAVEISHSHVHLTELAYKSIEPYPDLWNNPCDSISWTASNLYARKVSVKTGQILRLPLDAEWEFSCRAGTTGKYIWNDSVGKKDAFIRKWTDGKGHIVYSEFIGPNRNVGRFRPNPWGLYDMIGNVAEWTFDVFDETPTIRTIRGGELGDHVATRSPGLKHDAVAGFRLVLEINDKSINQIKKLQAEKHSRTGPSKM